MEDKLEELGRLLDILTKYEQVTPKTIDVTREIARNKLMIQLLIIDSSLVLEYEDEYKYWHIVSRQGQLY